MSEAEGTGRRRPLWTRKAAAVAGEMTEGKDSALRAALSPDSPNYQHWAIFGN